MRFGFLPVMFLGFMGAGVWLASADAPKWQVVVLLAGAVAVSFAAERILPYHAAWNTDRGDRRRDLVHAVVNEGLQFGGLLLVPVVVGAVGFVELWPTSWPFWLQVAVAVVVLDAGITVGHWWSHRWRPLWRLHSVHHSVTRFYGFNGLMKHPLHQLFETSIAITPLVIVGLPVQVATALVICVAVQLMIQHSNADFAAGPLRHVLAINQVHRFHHLKWGGVGDVNFGLFLTVWDRLMGTFVWRQDARFDSDVLGIAAEPDFPAAYLEQLIEPFRPYRPVPTDVPDVWRSPSRSRR